MDAELAMAMGREALDHGDYGQVLRLLEPLCSQQSPRSRSGGRLRLLMATALLGQGRSEEAISCCRPLLRCLDTDLRAQARDLLLVLEAPQLTRPRDWSLTLPELPVGELLEGAPRAVARPRPRPAPEPPPPVGPTRAPLGFGLIVLLLLGLLVLASLLGGCVRVRTEIAFAGPGRLQLAQQLTAASGLPSPWQQRYRDALRAGPFQRSEPSATADPATLTYRTPVLPARQALALLAGSLSQAADLAAMSLPPPQLELLERNWLLGVRQQLRIDLDLSAIEPLPGLDLSLRVSPVAAAAVRQAEPRAALRDPADRRALIWTLVPGRRNALRLRCWRWNPLGVGMLLILLALSLVLGLQRLRRHLGFGLPELPA
ncbi:MAG: DUF3153 domain-containing protein [Synechococcaceae cyanobacterium]|nr:DUF3153 domain-containing protein [Synechococcaceae cyanobacterium]